MGWTGKRWLAGAALLVVFGLWVTAADAVTCTASLAGWNPDPTLTNSNSCGPGNSANDTAADVNSAEPSSTVWTLVDKDDAAGLTDSALLWTSTAGTSGNWYIDANATSSAQFLIALKGGSSDADPIRWAWFIVDTSANAISCLAGYEYCGTWTMYGDEGRLKSLSHLSLYGSGTSVPETPVPEPSTVLLLGLSLVGGALVVRRRKN